MKRTILAISCMLGFLLTNEKCICQNQEFEEGYYITLKNDTVHNLLKNANSMYLVFYNKKGFMKKLTPSQVKGFTISGVEYVPMYLKEFDLKYFLAIKQRGCITLFQYEGIDSRYQMLPGGAVTGADIGNFRNHVSGFYIKKSHDDNLFAIPGGKRLLADFILKHFSDNEELVTKAKNLEYTYKDIELIIEKYNKNCIQE